MIDKLYDCVDSRLFMKAKALQPNEHCEDKGSLMHKAANSLCAKDVVVYIQDVATDCSQRIKMQPDKCLQQLCMMTAEALNLLMMQGAS